MQQHPGPPLRDRVTRNKSPAPARRVEGSTKPSLSQCYNIDETGLNKTTSNLSLLYCTLAKQEHGTHGSVNHPTGTAIPYGLTFSNARSRESSTQDRTACCAARSKQTSAAPLAMSVIACSVLFPKTPDQGQPCNTLNFLLTSASRTREQGTRLFTHRLARLAAPPCCLALAPVSNMCRRSVRQRASNSNLHRVCRLGYRARM